MRCKLQRQAVRGTGGSAEVAVMQIVRLVIAGGLMCSNEALASANIHSTAAQQTAALAPIRQELASAWKRCGGVA